MSDDTSDTEDQLADDIAAAERRIRREFMLAVAWLVLQTSQSDMEDHVKSGNVGLAADRADEMGARLATVINEVELDAARATAEIVAEATGKLASIDAHSPALVAQAKRNERRLIDGFLAEQRQMLQDALFDAASRGANIAVTARELRASIGLTPQQVGYVDNYRRLLERGSRQALDRELRDRRFDPSVEAAAAGDRTLTVEKIDRMVEGYRRKLLSYRADTIARTDALRAVNVGRQLGLEQAIARGDVYPEDVKRIWLHNDAQPHPRAFHEVMHGQERDVSTPFESGLGGLLMYPGDPDAGAQETARCKCGMRIVISASFAQRIAA